jgi:hypothetical protein
MGRLANKVNLSLRGLRNMPRWRGTRQGLFSLQGLASFEIVAESRLAMSACRFRSKVHTDALNGTPNAIVPYVVIFSLPLPKL